MHASSCRSRDVRSAQLRLQSVRQLVFQWHYFLVILTYPLFTLTYFLMNTRSFRFASSIASSTRTLRPCRPCIVSNLQFSLTRPFSVTMSDNAEPPNKKCKVDENGVEEWKKQPPYKIHHNNNLKGEAFKSLYDASCHCGKVEYQLSRKEPLDSKLCHCTTCQTQHGT